MDIVDRIFKLVDKKYKEQRDFAAVIGIAPSVVSAWRRRKSSSYHKYLDRIIADLDTTSEYLLTGERPSFSDKTVIRVSGRHQVSGDALEVAFAYDDASTEIQTAVRRVLSLPDAVAEPYNAQDQSGEVM